MLNKTEINIVVGALQDHYFSEVPPPDCVIVRPKTIVKHTDSMYSSKVTVEVAYIPRRPKSHTVHIMFKLNDKNKLLPETIEYL